MSPSSSPVAVPRALLEAWRERSLVLVLGAGVSIAQGLPTWRDLIVDLLVARSAKSPVMRELPAHYRRAMSAWLVDYFRSDPVVLARAVKNELRIQAKATRVSRAEQRMLFLETVRRHLYRAPNRADRSPSERTTLDAIADLIGRSDRGVGLAGVVTFNFDDLLEQELTRRGIAHYAVWGPRRRARRGVRILHAHGFLPAHGAIPPHEIVFAEDEYHRASRTPYHWALGEVVQHLRQHTALFVGLSMTDPNLRRVLDESFVEGDPPEHFLLQRRHRVKTDEKIDVIRDIDARARAIAAASGRKLAVHDPTQLLDALGAVLEQADAYDSELLESMGVRTLWLRAHGEIVGVLDSLIGARR